MLRSNEKTSTKIVSIGYTQHMHVFDEEGKYLNDMTAFALFFIVSIVNKGANQPKAKNISFFLIKNIIIRQGIPPTQKCSQQKMCDARNTNTKIQIGISFIHLWHLSILKNNVFFSRKNKTSEMKITVFVHQNVMNCFFILRKRVLCHFPSNSR